METVTIKCVKYEWVLVNYKEIINYYKLPFYKKWFTKKPIKIMESING